MNTKRALFVMAPSTPQKSWIDIPNSCDFSLDNIPFGVCSFSVGDSASSPSGTVLPLLSAATPRCCTAIGEYAVDLHLLAEAGLLDQLTNEQLNFHPRYIFCQPTLNKFMECDKRVWTGVRNRLISLFTSNNNSEEGRIVPDSRLHENIPLQKLAMHPLRTTQCHLPATIGDYTDFYSSREHATNVGIMFRGKDNALQPNWLHMPIGYHGRSSSIMPSGSAGKINKIRRPCGQLQIDPNDATKGSSYGPCEQMDFELEVAFFVGGRANDLGQPMTINEAKDRIFGYVLMNDWSARDIQKWEYVPLGPFTSKNFATTISTWVVTSMALEPFRCETSAGEQGGIAIDDQAKLGCDPTPLEYLRDPNYGASFDVALAIECYLRRRIYALTQFVSNCPNNTTLFTGSYDVKLSVSLQPQSTTQPRTQICTSNLKHMYWSSIQQLVHHSVTGCPLNPGDLLASGTISGKGSSNFGSMLELSWKGSRDIVLNDGDGGGGGEVRKFLKDGDTIIMEGWCEREGVRRVGFGQCSGTVQPAIPFPYTNRAETHQPKRQHATKYAEFRLYGYWRSSCTWRVRIALAAKGIQYKTVPVDVYNRDQTANEYANPMKQVPTLEFVEGGKTVVRISQSLAIIEFLESAFADCGGRLLPLDPITRAKVKEIAEIVNSGTQPLQNVRVLNALNKLAGAGYGEEFGKDGITKGLASIEQLLSPYHSEHCGAGSFAMGSFGPTLADVCLVPQLYNARLFGVDVESLFPTLLKIEAVCNAHPWFHTTHPTLQIDAKI